MTTLSRRKLLATGAATLAAPLFARRSLASSGVVNVFAWGDYFQPNIVEAFEAATGIKINVSTYGSNEEAASKLRAAGVEPLDFDRRPTDEPCVFGWMPAAGVFFRDPDGHLLEYLAMLQDEPRPEAGVVHYAEWTRRWAPWSCKR